jgi:hypothetical protein
MKFVVKHREPKKFWSGETPNQHSLEDKRLACCSAKFICGNAAKFWKAVNSLQFSE